MNRDKKTMSLTEGLIWHRGYCDGFGGRNDNSGSQCDNDKTTYLDGFTAGQRAHRQSRKPKFLDRILCLIYGS